MKRFLFLSTTIWLVASILTAHAQEAEHHDERDDDHHHGLHFSHPLVGESISPDTKVRLEHEFEPAKNDEGSSQSVTFEGEYAFDPAFSIGIDVPAGFVSPADGPTESGLGSIAVSLKFANAAFSEHGVLLGYGIEVGLPTGNDEKGIGSDHLLTYEPYLDAGYKSGGLELSGFARFGIPTGQAEGEEVATDFGYNLSALYHVSTRVQALFELDGESALSGGDESIASITPGIKVRPFEGDGHTGLILGFGVSLPITSDAEFSAATQFSAFYHF